MDLVTPVATVPVGELGRVHFVGLGGAGMSGIARILLARGVAVSGSDQAASAQLDELAALGAVVHVGHAAESVAEADTAVTTPSAIRPDNPELVEARRRGIRIVPPAAGLASIMLGKQGPAAAAALPVRVRTYGESEDADYRLTGVTGLGMATRLTVTPRVRELPRPADGIGGPDGDAGRAGEPGVPPGPVMLTIEVPGRHNA